MKSLSLNNVLIVAVWRQTQDDSAYRTWATGFKLRVELSIQQWIGQAGYEAGKLLRSLRDKAQQWWYFLEHPQVPPDNNLAERSLRLAVTKRKVSGGSRSMARFQQTADLLTVIQTCRRQGRSVKRVFPTSLKGTSRVISIDLFPFTRTNSLNSLYSPLQVDEL